jgi:hypothetical protein
MKNGAGSVFAMYLSFIFLTLYTLILLNDICFTHRHTMSDGSVIVHAHPYNKSKEKEADDNHQHTGFEFVLLQHFQLRFFEKPEEIILACKIFSPHFIRDTENNYQFELITISGSRAPPLIYS